MKRYSIVVGLVVLGVSAGACSSEPQGEPEGSTSEALPKQGGGSDYECNYGAWPCRVAGRKACCTDDPAVVMCGCFNVTATSCGWLQIPYCLPGTNLCFCSDY